MVGFRNVINIPKRGEVRAKAAGREDGRRQATSQVECCLLIELSPSYYEIGSVKDFVGKRPDVAGRVRRTSQR
jgi:hypothetical protein